jgi:hypothetical protein
MVYKFEQAYQSILCKDFCCKIYPGTPLALYFLRSVQKKTKSRPKGSLIKTSRKGQ